jgi:hypothetical protein
MDFHLDYIDYRKYVASPGMMFWGAFKWGNMRLVVFFQLKDGKKINTTIYQD